MIRKLLAQLDQSGSPSDVLLESGAVTMTRSDLLAQVEALARYFRAEAVRTVALYADNGIEWIIADLAGQLANIRIIPVPLFFSAGQVRHAISIGGADAVLTDQPVVAGIPAENLDPAIDQPPVANLVLYRRTPDHAAQLPSDTQKITFTSGTTGTPKGVCLSASQQFSVANAIAAVIDLYRPKHLSVLPLSTLLENLAGIYAPLLAGGTIVAPPLAELGLNGSCGLDVGRLLACVVQHQPRTLILVPEMLDALTLAAEQGWHPPQSLEFIAVGGGKVAPDLLRRARDAGLPVFEGYGLSECGSVVSLNVPGIDRVGSVGRPLPHVHVQIEDGEIVVAGNNFLGYADQPDTWILAPVRTGDLGHLDRDGFVYIDGRAKNQIISSYGRNVSPEWVESELMAGSLFQQAVVFGDARPYCTALVYPRNAATRDQDISAWIKQTNLRLPDYARVQAWFRLAQPLQSHDGMTTDNGRPKRSNIEHKFASVIDSLYDNNRKVYSQ